MSEKISESHIREEKVKKVKEKILSEIEREQTILKTRIEEGSDYCFDAYVEEYYQLMQLKAYIERKNSFCAREAVNESMDYVVYMVSSKNLDVWLQEDYNFTLRFLSDVKECPGALFEMLTDNHFGYHFTSILETILYDKKQKNKTEE